MVVMVKVVEEMVEMVNNVMFVYTTQYYLNGA